MKKWNLIIDVAKCQNCNNCMIATRDEHVGNDFPGYAAPQPLHGHDWIKINRRVRGSGDLVDVAYLPTTCNHCDNAPCIDKAGDGAIYKRPDGIVIIDPIKAKGRSDLVDACPYGAIFWNEELQLPQKWIFDAHLLDQGWTEPRCQQSCPTGAFQALSLEDVDMQKLVAKEGLEVLQPELKTKPRVYYKALYRFTKGFIAGSVVAYVGAAEECVPGADVTLFHEGKIVARCRTETYGDFKFDGIDEDGKSYRVEITHERFGKASLDVTAPGSVCLGVIQLSTDEHQQS
jgi:Fe-S-cluster-containing dehydrogenase component